MPSQFSSRSTRESFQPDYRVFGADQRINCVCQPVRPTDYHWNPRSGVGFKFDIHGICQLSFANSVGDGHKLVSKIGSLAFLPMAIAVVEHTTV